MLLALSWTAGPVQAGEGAPVTFRVEAQPLPDALNSWAEQAGLQLIWPVETAAGTLRSPELSGRFSPEEALRRLLKGSGLTFSFVDKQTVSIRPSSASSADAAPMHATTHLANSGADGMQRIESASGEKPARSEGSAENAEGRIQEVIVTATKRQERAQDIPMSIAVIGNQDIERRGLIGMEDYLRSIPGVNQVDSGPRDNAIVIRGITTSPQSENSASGAAVASYFDETPITGAGGRGSAGIDVRPVDIERIEILRGPQGTTYGSASLSGTVRMIPVKPKLDGFGAKVAAAYSDTSGSGSDNSMIQGVINVPVVRDKFAIRVVGYRYDESGFYRNVAGTDPVQLARADGWAIGSETRGIRDDVGQTISTGGRLSALWQPTENLSLTLNHLTQTIEQDGRPIANISTGGDAYEQAIFPIAASLRERGEMREIADNTIHLSNAVLNYDLGWAGLTSAVSYIDSKSAWTLDLSGVLGNYPASNNTPGEFISRTFETRLASQLSGRLQFLAGVFYENVDEDQSQTVSTPGAPSPNPFGTDPLALIGVTRDLEQRALFAEVSYDVTDKLTATVGSRYFKYEKGETGLREGPLFGAAVGTGIPTIRERRDDHSVFKAGLEFKPTVDSLLYATWAEGFRLGRTQAGLSPATCDLNSDGVVDGTSVTIRATQEIDSDYLENYEIGSKLMFLDRRMALDVSVYHIKWDGLPTSAVATACNTLYTANAGAATSDGVELQASLLVAGGLRIDFGAGYTEAELSETSPGLGVKGARLPGSPKMNANVAAQYDFNLRGHEAFVRADSFYTGEFYGNLPQSPLTRAGDYIKVDARAGLKIKDLSVELFVRNITNADSFTWRGLSNANSFAGFRLRPRTVGLQFGYRFE